MGYSPLACKFIPANGNNYTPNRSAWGYNGVSEICIHYMAGNCSIETLGDIWQDPYRYGSSTYGIGSDGRIACYVDENDIAWCNSNWESNCRSASIETANLQPSSEVTGAALDSLIRLVADIAKRNNMGTLVKGQNVTWHSMYTDTSCPGDYLRSKMDYIVEQANKINSGQPIDPPKPNPDQILHVGSKVMINGVFRVDEILLESAKYPNGALGCYATCYGSPCGADDYIPCGPLAQCDPDKGRADYDAVLEVGEYWMTDKVFTVLEVELPTNYTPNGVAVLEADGVRFRIDCGPLFEIKD